MPYRSTMKGEDELEFIRETVETRALMAALWFLAAACIFSLSLLPLGAERRGPYPWGAASIIWLLSAATAFAGGVTLTSLNGVTFDRKGGVIVEWECRFGRRRQRTRPLSGFNEFHVTTYLGVIARNRGVARWYDHDLRGSRERLSLTGGSPFAREESEKVAAELAEFLKLPIVLEDRNPGDKL